MKLAIETGAPGGQAGRRCCAIGNTDAGVVCGNGKRDASKRHQRRRYQLVGAPIRRERQPACSAVRGLQEQPAGRSPDRVQHGARGAIVRRAAAIHAAMHECPGGVPMPTDRRLQTLSSIRFAALAARMLAAVSRRPERVERHGPAGIWHHSRGRRFRAVRSGAYRQM